MSYIVSLYVPGNRRAIEVLGDYATRQEADFYGAQEIARVQNIALGDRNETFDFATRYTVALAR